MSDPHPSPKKFHHIGLRAMEPQSSEHYVVSSKCWVTNPNEHPQHIEYLRYEPDSPIGEEFIDSPHVAYEVEQLEPHLEGKDIYLEPFEVGDPPFATVAFTREHGLFVEYMRFYPGRAWFES